MTDEDSREEKLGEMNPVVPSDGEEEVRLNLVNHLIDRVQFEEYEHFKDLYHVYTRPIEVEHIREKAQECECIEVYAGTREVPLHDPFPVDDHLPGVVEPAVEFLDTIEDCHRQDEDDVEHPLIGVVLQEVVPREYLVSEEQRDGDCREKRRVNDQLQQHPEEIQERFRSDHTQLRDLRQQFHYDHLHWEMQTHCEDSEPLEEVRGVEWSQEV